VILLTGKRIPRVIEMNVEGHLLITKQEISYLGVQVDNCRRSGAHLEKVCGKADALIGTLRSLLPNVNGLSRFARKFYYEVWESVVLYATPVWAKEMGDGKGKE
jgi:hypothetical protein